jgi:hypothetical protein
MDRAEKALFRKIIQGPDLNPKRKKEYQEAVLIIGRRGSKSTLAAAIACYEASTVDWRKVGNLRESELAWIFVMSVKEEHAKDIGRNMIFANMRNSPILSNLIVDTKIEAQEAGIPRTRVGTMILKNGAAITALPCSHKVGRGYAVAVLIVDEIAFFARESNSGTTDQEIYDSVLPSQLQFGDYSKRIIISSPADKTGVLWDKWRMREKNRDLYFCMRAPTWRVRPDIPKEEFKKMRALSPIGYDREFGAEFANTLSPLLRPEWIAQATREEDDILPKKIDVLYYMAIDTAFGERDRFSITIGHSEGELGTRNFRIIIDYCRIVEETLDNDVHDEAIRIIDALYREYDVFEISADQYQFEAFSKNLESLGMNCECNPWTASTKRSKYGRLRAAFSQGMIEIPNSPDLVEELTNIQVKFQSSGQFVIEHRSGFHDDMADTIADITGQLYDEDAIPAGVEFF